MGLFNSGIIAGKSWFFYSIDRICHVLLVNVYQSHNVVEVLHMICFRQESANLGMFPTVDCFHYAIQDGMPAS
jgi:hypothetical protein